MTREPLAVEAVRGEAFMVFALERDLGFDRSPYVQRKRICKLEIPQPVF